MNKGKQIIILKDELSQLKYEDKALLDELRQRTEMIIRNIFGKTSHYLVNLRRIQFTSILQQEKKGNGLKERLH